MEKTKTAHKNLVKNPQGKIATGRRKRKWQGSTEISFK
jgi:hypothetical protein